MTDTVIDIGQQAVARGARIAFVGAGAIGGYVGAHLSKAGFDVTLVDPWAQHVEAIQKHGLLFSGTLGEYAIRVPALHADQVANLADRPVDIAFICMKLYDTEWAARLIRPCLAAGGLVVTMQNGLVEDLVADIVGRERTLGCIASTLSAEAWRAGAIIRTRQPGGARYTIFRAGELDGRITPRLDRLVWILGHVDSAKATTNLWGERWAKLVANTMTTGVSGMTGLSLKSVIERPATRRLATKLGADAAKIGIALGFRAEPIRTLPAEVWVAAGDGDAAALASVQKAFEFELERMTADGFSGTAQDLRKGRRTEIEYMNGYVARRGIEAGVPSPAHEAVARAVLAIERGEAVADESIVDKIMSKEA